MRIKGHCKTSGNGRDFMAWDEVEISDVHCAHVGHRIMNISLEWCEGDVVKACVRESSVNGIFSGRIDSGCYVTHLDIEINDTNPYEIYAHNVDVVTGKSIRQELNVPLQDVIKEEPQEFKFID